MPEGSDGEQKHNNGSPNSRGPRIFLIIEATEWKVSYSIFLWNRGESRTNCQSGVSKEGESRRFCYYAWEFGRMKMQTC